MDGAGDVKKQLAVQVARDTAPADRETLRSYLKVLLDLREQPLPIVDKAKQAVSITLRAKVIWPVLKTIFKQVKRQGWDKRTASQRIGMVAAGSAIAVFGSAQA